jgi:hypothetical protein
MDPIGGLRDRFRDGWLDEACHEAIAPFAPHTLTSDEARPWQGVAEGIVLEARESHLMPLLQLARAEPEHERHASPAVPSHRYTNKPLEVPARTTTPKPVEVASALREAWPALTDEGARTLTAQFMAETGNGKYCFDWNLGNVKAGPNEPHMYLRNVWEVDTVARAESWVARSNGPAHIATPDEIKKHGWMCPIGSAVVVFQPPDPQCRFRAYTSFADGARKWLNYHRAIAAKDPTFLASINRGDTAAVAHTLKKAHSYTAAESDYARLIAAKKTEIDRILGIAPMG